MGDDEGVSENGTVWHFNRAYLELISSVQLHNCIILLQNYVCKKLFNVLSCIFSLSSLHHPLSPANCKILERSTVQIQWK